MFGTIGEALSVVFFGTTGRLSAPPLRALLGADVNVRAVVLPALTSERRADLPPILPLRASGSAVPTGRTAPKPLPMAGTSLEPNIVRLAAQHSIPLFEVARLADPQTRATLAALDGDLICVACFPWRLPRSLLALPRLGALNLHPSLLPANRGPDPLFWTFQRGERETGVTIHRMDAGLDTGPILAQERVTLPEGTDEATLERALAERGAQLLVGVAQQLAFGSAVPIPQDEAQATRYPWPRPDDYLIWPSWSARRAYIFACGILGRAQPPLVRLANEPSGGETFAVREPLGYDADATLGAPWQLEGDVLRFQCAPGIFHARVVAWTEGEGS